MVIINAEGRETGGRSKWFTNTREGKMSAYKNFSAAAAIVVVAIANFPAQAEQLNKNVDGGYVAVFGGAGWTKGLDLRHNAVFAGGPEIGYNFLLPDTGVWMGGAVSYRFGGPKQKLVTTMTSESSVTTITESLDQSALGTLSGKLGLKLGTYFAPYVEGGWVFGASHRLDIVFKDGTNDPVTTTIGLTKPNWFIGQGVMLGDGDPWTVSVRGRYFSDTTKVFEAVFAYHF